MSYQTFDPEHLDLHFEAHALRVTLDRPQVLNALSGELLRELREVLEAAAADEAVRAVLLTGAGRGFCSGADLSSTAVDGDIGAILESRYHPVVRAIVGMEKPVVAGVNGVAAGAGLSLALACDYRLLSTRASFAVGFTGIGLVMDAGGSYLFTRLLGPARALELAYSNRRVGAEEAVALGLGERIVPEDSFAADAWAHVLQLAAGPTRSFGLVKREVYAALANDFEAQLALEAKLQSQAAQTEDVREGITAFREKRPPAFRGR